MVKRYKKYESKYKRKYGYSIPDVCQILGWSRGTVYNYFQNKAQREAMLEAVKALDESKWG